MDIRVLAEIEGEVVVLVRVVECVHVDHMDAVHNNADRKTGRVPVFLVQVCDTLACGGGQVVEDNVEFGGVRVEAHRSQSALSPGHVGAGQGLHLVVLKSTVLVPEAFRAGARGSGQISIGLELPVGPSDEMDVGLGSDLVDLLGAGTFGEAGSKLTDEKRDSKTLGIFGSLIHRLLMPLPAYVTICDLGLAARALASTSLAAVRVHVEHVLVGANLTARWRLETDSEVMATEEGHVVRHGAWLEPHLLGSIVRLVLVEDLLVQRGEILLVHVTRHEKHRVTDWIRREWLVKRIISNNVGVVRKASGKVIPITHKLVLETILVGEERAEGCDVLLGHIVRCKVTSLAVRNHGIVILVFSKTERVNISADAKLLVQGLEKQVSPLAEAVIILSQSLLCIEVGHTLTAHGARKDVLVSIDKRVNTSISKLVDQHFDTV